MLLLPPGQYVADMAPCGMIVSAQPQFWDSLLANEYCTSTNNKPTQFFLNLKLLQKSVSVHVKNYIFTKLFLQTTVPSNLFYSTFFNFNDSKKP
jgi:hypothetical protein